MLRSCATKRRLLQGIGVYPQKNWGLSRKTGVYPKKHGGYPKNMGVIPKKLAIKMLFLNWSISPKHGGFPTKNDPCGMVGYPMDGPMKLKTSLAHLSMRPARAASAHHHSARSSTQWPLAVGCEVQHKCSVNNSS